MLMQIFPRGRGKGAGPIDYVTSPVGLVFDEHGNPPSTGWKARNISTYSTPVVLSGNPSQMIALIDSLEFSFRYTSGVLSMASKDGPLLVEEEAELMADFESVAFAGLEPDQYSILWVRHPHAGHHELHFIVPRIELGTDK